MHAKATLDGLEVSSSRLFFRVDQSADVAPQGAYGQALMWKKIRHRHLRLRSFDPPSNFEVWNAYGAVRQSGSRHSLAGFPAASCAARQPLLRLHGLCRSAARAARRWLRGGVAQHDADRRGGAESSSGVDPVWLRLWLVERRLTDRLSQFGRRACH